MKRSTLYSLKSQAGQVLQSTMILAVIMAGSTVIGTMVYLQNKVAVKKKQDIEFGIQIQSGIETMLLAYRIAETRYIDQLASWGCETANPFLQAMKEGHACAASTDSLDIFTGTDAATTSNIYSYNTKCTISPATADCSTGLKEVMNIGVSDPAQKFQNSIFRFFINTVIPEKSIVEFIANIQVDSTTNVIKRSFAIRPILPNAAHLEADGRVVQENPDPLARCTGNIWADFLFFHPVQQKCLHFVNLGSGTGLGFYRGRYFGFRPTDGQVIDMLLASDLVSPSYMVDEDGRIGGTGDVVFPPYKKDVLINTDDITLVEDQLFFVALSSDAAQIGTLIGPNRLRVCDLGGMGWSQSYAGIAALSWSDPLIPADAAATNRSAVFFLKTDAGDMLTAVVRRSTNTEPPDATQFTCAVFKDKNIQQIEYTRTLGFDRTADSKPYYIY